MENTEELVDNIKDEDIQDEDNPNQDDGEDEPIKVEKVKKPRSAKQKASMEKARAIRQAKIKLKLEQDEVEQKQRLDEYLKLKDTVQRQEEAIKKLSNTTIESDSEDSDSEPERKPKRRGRNSIPKGKVEKSTDNKTTKQDVVEREEIASKMTRQQYMRMLGF